MAKDKKVQWHPAFYGAMHLEFKENKQELEFIEELILNTLPLRIDMMIVKKKNPCVIHNEIGQIFRENNLVEYKSPDDSLNYDVFLKGIAYAYLYKSQEAHVDEISLEEITLTFIRERKPIKLFKKLLSEKFVIEEKWAGIYYIIKEGSICIQIIVTKELSKKNHIWLNALSAELDENNITELIHTTQRLEHKDEKLYADSLWEVVTRVNEKIVRKVREDDDMCRALAEIMKPELDEAFDNGFNNGFNSGFNNGFTDGLNQAKNDGKILAFRNMIKDGMSRELAQKYTELSDQLAEEVLAEFVSKYIQIEG